MTTAEAGHNSPDATIMHARTTGQTIRCTAPDGSTAVFKRLADVFPDRGLWLCIEAGPRGVTGPGRIVGLDAVKNDVVSCWPDVEVVDEHPTTAIESP